MKITKNIKTLGNAVVGSGLKEKQRKNEEPKIKDKSKLWHSSCLTAKVFPLFEDYRL